MRAWLRTLKKGRLAAAGFVVLAIIVAVVLIVVLGSKNKTTSNGLHPSGPSTTAPHVASVNCPLTDTPAPGGHVPQREPMAVKIGNEPGGARPQSGLNEADVVYDTPAEGGIMRYIAIYQCQNATSIGPVRSVRWVDYHILAEFKHAGLAFVGGIQPNQSAVAGSPFLDDANDFLHFAAFHGDPARVPPDATYTSTTALWGLFKHHPAPAPIFYYSQRVPSGEAHPAASLAINFSYGTDVVWKWNPSTGLWDHTYAGVPDVDALTNQPVSTNNIVVQIVHYQIGPYCESNCPGGSGDVESNTIGKGPGMILRNGQLIRVTWHRATYNSTMTFTDAKGQMVGLSPGRTWVEMVLDTTAELKGAVSVTP